MKLLKNIAYDELVKNVNAIQITFTSNLAEKTSYNTKIAEIQKKILDHNHGKCITTQEFNKLTLDNFATRLALVISTTKADIADIVKKTQNEYIVNIVIYYILYYCKKKS